MESLFTGYSDRIKALGIETIGVASWYSVGDDARVEWQEGNELIEKHEAPLKLFGRPRPADVFKRACATAQIKHVETDTEDEFINYNVRHIVDDKNFIWRMIVAERVDNKDKSLGYTPLSKIIFDKTLEQVTFIPEDPTVEQDIIYQIMVDHIEEYIATRGGLISAMSLRLAIGSAYDTLKALTLRQGGTVYFVASEQVEALERLAACTAEMEGVEVHMLPCIDDDVQRQNVRKAFESESVRETQALLVALQELETTKTVPAKKFAELKTRYDEQAERIKEYSKLLSLQVSEADITLSLAKLSIERIIQNAIL